MQWLKPQPVPIAVAVPQHESFAQEGDEYKFPQAENIPDATTDPSQIRVLAVIDPTAKPLKSAEPAGAQLSAATSPSPEQNPAGATEGDSTQSSAKQDPENAAIPGNAPVEPPAANSVSVPAPQQPQAPTRTTQPISSTVRNSSAPNNIVPSSLKSQTASMTPDASGTKPAEAAMSSIEPVILPELAIWNLLAQPVDLVYPESAKASGQRGSVVLQVLIGRDGTVQDAKFMQGSLVFARAAIDGLKQWRFKPYLMNGRPVSVQSQITLNFKPPS
jgi:TonB family protein